MKPRKGQCTPHGNFPEHVVVNLNNIGQPYQVQYGFDIEYNIDDDNNETEYWSYWYVNVPSLSESTLRAYGVPEDVVNAVGTT